MSGRKSPQGSSTDRPSTGDAFIQDPDMLRLFDYWRSLRAGRALPAKSDIDPLEISWALSRIYLVDHSPEDGFVYCLAGNDIAGIFGRANLKGLRPRDFLPKERAEPVERLFQQVVDERCIMWMKGLIYFRADRTPIGERLVLPLGDAASETVTGVLGMTVIHSVAVGTIQPEDYASERFFPIDNLP